MKVPIIAMPQKTKSTTQHRNPIIPLRAIQVLSGLCILLIMFHIINPFSRPEQETALVTPNGEVTPAEHAQLQEIASLLDSIYTTLVKMRFIPPEAIMRAPHRNPALPAEKQVQKLDPLIAELHDILPYYDRSKGENLNFIFKAEFAHFRNSEFFWNDRKKFESGWFTDTQADTYWIKRKEKTYFKPWVTPLTNFMPLEPGHQYQSTMFYDARQNRIWIIDQLTGETSDPALKGTPNDEKKSADGNDFDHIPSRPAPEVLKDIHQSFLTLERVPGGGRFAPVHWNAEKVKALYLKNGWPDNFDGNQFTTDLLRFYARQHSKHKAHEPIRLYQMYGGENQFHYQYQDLNNTQEQLLNATTIDERYALEWKALRIRLRIEYGQWLAERFKEDAERLCPGGVCVKEEEEPLWELKELESDMEDKRKSVAEYRSGLASGELDIWTLDLFKNRLPKMDEEILLLEEALEQCREEVHHLCSERGWEPFPKDTKSDRERQRLMRRIEDDRAIIARERSEYIRKVTEWASQLPEDAITAKTESEGEVQRMEAALQQKETSIQWMMEELNRIK